MRERKCITKIVVEEVSEVKGMLVSSVIYPIEIKYGADTILLAPRQRTASDILKSKLMALPTGCVFVPVN